MRALSSNDALATDQIPPSVLAAAGSVLHATKMYFTFTIYRVSTACKLYAYSITHHMELNKATSLSFSRRSCPR
jgi:hypothetical protein